MNQQPSACTLRQCSSGLQAAAPRENAASWVACHHRFASSPHAFLPAGGQQGAEKQTPATPPCSRTSGPPDLPPGFAASAVRSNPQQTPRASQSTSGVAPPQMPTPSFAGHQASGAHQQGWLSHGGSVAASNDQSEMLQRAPASDPHRPQRTLTQAAGRGPPAQASDRPPGFSAVATPQPQGSHRRGLPPSPSSSWPHTSTQVQPESHRVSLFMRLCIASSCPCHMSCPMERGFDF